MITHTEPQGGKTKTPACGLRPLDKNAIAKTESLMEGLRKLPKDMVEVVDKVDVGNYKLNCKNEYGKLKTVVISLPTYLDWAQPINKKEESCIKPDRSLAMDQHIAFINTLLNYGVKIVVIEPSHGRLEGVYTRDPGMVIGDKFIKANLVAEPRWPEMDTIAGGIQPPKGVMLEGGNVIMQGEHVLVGVGKRGNWESVEWLKSELGTSYEVKGIALNPDILHLDCVFSPVRPPNGKKGGALIYAPALERDHDIAFLEKIYGQLHYLKDHEYPALAANIVWLDEHTIIANPNCKIAYGVLTKVFGLDAIALDMSEIVKADGGPRCSTLPLWRD